MLVMAVGFARRVKGVLKRLVAATLCPVVKIRPALGALGENGAIVIDAVEKRSASARSRMRIVAMWQTQQKSLLATGVAKIQSIAFGARGWSRVLAVPFAVKVR